MAWARRSSTAAVTAGAALILTLQSQLSFAYDEWDFRATWVYDDASTESENYAQKCNV